MKYNPLFENIALSAAPSTSGRELGLSVWTSIQQSPNTLISFDSRTSFHIELSAAESGYLHRKCPRQPSPEGTS